MSDLQKTSALDDAILDCTMDVKRYKGVTSKAWNEMMTAASLKSLISIRLELLLFIDRVGTGSKVKKHAKKLSAFFNRLRELNDIDLNSKTYILKVLTPAKILRAEIEEWKKQSVTNIITKKEIEVIETTVEIETENIVSLAA